jgi:hypothetical protein
MTTKFKLVQFDTLPHIQLALYDEKTGKPIDLSAAGTTVRMYFRRFGQKTLKQTLVLAKLPGVVTRVDERTNCAVVQLGAPYEANGSGGRCSVQWTQRSLDTEGAFQGEIEVSYADGSRLTIPETLRFDVRKQYG